LHRALTNTPVYGFVSDMRKSGVFGTLDPFI